MSNDIVVGIDLGTTNSAIATVIDGTPQLIPIDGQPLLPSVVGLDPTGQLLVGHTARNQALLFPERTVKSIKRRMGEDCQITIGERTFTPIEISALILRRLKEAAESHLNQAVHRAVITVPAYFSDAQRVATKEAGEIAGFTVERIINEPTAAALCYVTDESPEDTTFLVYDLGGGTFDVSIVRTRGQVTEVLASHGDTELGGDDFDELLQSSLQDGFTQEHKISLDDNLRAQTRLNRAAEEAKIDLSTESFVSITEDNLAEKDGVGYHLNRELSRRDYEELIQTFLSQTRTSIQTALKEAKLLLRDIDEILLVGGSTRIPLVSDLIQQELGQLPRKDINPDTAVVMGAAIQGARLMGQSSQILVDVSPFSFGTSHFGELHGMPSPDCYRAIIKRNTPIPTRQTETFMTMYHGQEKIEVEVFQGEHDDARENLLLGTFMVEGLSRNAPENSPIVFELKLDLDGILNVSVIERQTGLRKDVTISDAFRKSSEEDILKAKERLSDLFAEDHIIDIEPKHEAAPSNPEIQPAFTQPDDLNEAQVKSWEIAVLTLLKASTMAESLEDTDREEVEELAQTLKQALQSGDIKAVTEQQRELADVLFYLE